MARLIEVCRYHGFYNFAQKTKKYKELWKSNSGKVAIVLAFIVVGLFYAINNSSNNHTLLGIYRTILLFMIPSLIGMLGFLIAGLALMASIITDRAVKNIDKICKIDKLAGILYSFYFEAGVTAGCVILMLIAYIVTYYPVNICNLIAYCCIFVIVYFVAFSVLYAVSLIGTCLNFFFLNVYYNNLDT